MANLPDNDLARLQKQERLAHEAYLAVDLSEEERLEAAKHWVKASLAVRSYKAKKLLSDGH
jgi:hypothetical protein